MNASATPTHSLGLSLSDPGRESRSAATLIGVGAVEIALGLIAIVWPAVASVSIAILLGSLLVAAGVVGLAAAFAARGLYVLLRLVLGGFGVAAGIYLLAYPDEGLIGLTKLLVLVLLLSGAALIAVGILGRENRGMLLAAGAFDVLLGALVWAELPSSASWALGLLVGFHFLASGIQTTSSGLALRRLSQSPKSDWGGKAATRA
jgi:uncharacterized membrane protein HdeD (DUF308 family)